MKPVVREPVAADADGGEARRPLEQCPGTAGDFCDAAARRPNLASGSSRFPLLENLMVSPHELVRLLIAEIDRNLPAAYTDLTQARACWARSPTAAQGRACATAAAYLDELIDLRVAVRRRAGVTGVEAPA